MEEGVDTIYEKLEALQRDKAKRQMDIKKLQAEIEEAKIELRKLLLETDNPIGLRNKEVNFFLFCKHDVDLLHRIKSNTINGNSVSKWEMWRVSIGTTSINLPGQGKHSKKPNIGRHHPSPFSIFCSFQFRN